MSILNEITQNQYLVSIGSGLIGFLSSWFTFRFFNKRGVLSWSVVHNRIGVSADDALFGSITIQWNGTSIPNLYLSTIELKNDSLNDYENVAVCTFTSNTKLFAEQTQVMGSPNVLEWTTKYRDRFIRESGAPLTDLQMDIYNGQREHLIPVLNRGQSVKITYLNSATTPDVPSIFLSTSVKGAKLKFQRPRNIVFGVPQGQAAAAGVLLGILLYMVLINAGLPVWFGVLIAMLYGFVAQLPGAYAIKAIRLLRDSVGG